MNGRGGNGQVDGDYGLGDGDRHQYGHPGQLDDDEASRQQTRYRDRQDRKQREQEVKRKPLNDRQLAREEARLEKIHNEQGIADGGSVGDEEELAFPPHWADVQSLQHLHPLPEELHHPREHVPAQPCVLSQPWRHEPARQHVHVQNLCYASLAAHCCASIARARTPDATRQVLHRSAFSCSRAASEADRAASTLAR